MNQLLYYGLHLFLSSLAIANPAQMPSAKLKKAPPPCTIKSYANKAQILPDENVVFTIEAQCLKQTPFEILEIGNAIKGLRIINQEESENTDDYLYLSKTKSYELAADIEGTYGLPPGIVMYQQDAENKKIQSSPLFVQVGTTDSTDNSGSQDSLSDIHDIKPLWLNSMPWLYFLLGILVAFLILLSVFFIKKRSQNKQKVPKIVDPPHITAKKELQRLKLAFEKSSLSQKQIHFGLSECIRTYLESLYKIPLSDMTIEEIQKTNLKSHHHSLDSDFINKLSLSETVKYTDISLSDSENRSIFDHMERIILETEPETQVKDPDSETQNGEEKSWL